MEPVRSRITFELSQLRCFVAVAEELHFGHAAVRLHMTQPPLSRQVQLLEHHLGVELLTRSSRTVRLTTAGKRFLPEARQILRLAESASVTARRAARGDSGSVTIGFTAASGYGLIPAMIARCRQRLPDIEVSLRELVTTEQINGLSAGWLDLALLRPHPALADFESRCIVREPLVAALPTSHPLTQTRLPALSDFDRVPFVMYSPIEARYFHDLITGACSVAGVKPDYVQYTSQIHSVLALVSAGLGVSLVPAAATNLRFAGVVFRSLRKVHSSAGVEVHLAWRQDNDNPAQHLIRAACLEYCDSAD